MHLNDSAQKEVYSLLGIHRGHATPGTSVSDLPFQSTAPKGSLPRPRDTGRRVSSPRFRENTTKRSCNNGGRTATPPRANEWDHRHWRNARMAAPGCWSTVSRRWPSRSARRHGGLFPFFLFFLILVSRSIPLVIVGADTSSSRTKRKFAEGYFIQSSRRFCKSALN